MKKKKSRNKKQKEEISEGCKECNFYKTHPWMCNLENCPEIGGA